MFEPEEKSICLPLMEVFRLNEFVVHPKRNLIENGSYAQLLEPKIMDLLCVMASHSGGVMMRDELLQIVWGNAAVGDERLTRAISLIRKAFRDDPKSPRFLETVPKRGYRLICTVDR